MYTVNRRVYGKAADGRTVLLYTPGTKLSDEEAKRAGLIAGKAEPELPARGLTILEPRTGDVDDAPAAPKPLDRMTLAQLREVCAAEDVDPGDANTRAEYIAAIEAARVAAAGEED